MTDPSRPAKIHPSNQSEPLPAVAAYLQQLNQQVLPAVAKTGSVPNAINAREGLANLTRTYISQTVAVALIIDDIIQVNADLTNTAVTALPITKMVAIQSDAYDVPVRIFCPSSSATKTLFASAAAALPVLLYFHGGGGSAGSVSVYQQILCRLANHTGHIVVAPEYRLAPENPYPCAQNDACTVLLGINTVLKRHNLVTSNDIVVMGDSHGGALVSNLLRDPRITQAAVFDNICAQILLYPSVDFTMSYPSIEKYASGYLLTKERIKWYFDQYFQHGEDRHTQSALFASQAALIVQPPALVFNAAIDPLHDEGVAYADALRKAGVSTQHINFNGVIHAYMNMEDLNPDICQQTYQAITDFLSCLSQKVGQI